MIAQRARFGGGGFGGKRQAPPRFGIGRSDELYASRSICCSVGSAPLPPASSCSVDFSTRNLLADFVHGRTHSCLPPPPRESSKSSAADATPQIPQISVTRALN